MVQLNDRSISIEGNLDLRVINKQGKESSISLPEGATLTLPALSPSSENQPKCRSKWLPEMPKINWQDCFCICFFVYLLLSETETEKQKKATKKVEKEMIRRRKEIAKEQEREKKKRINEIIKEKEKEVTNDKKNSKKGKVTSRQKQVKPREKQLPVMRKPKIDQKVINVNDTDQIDQVDGRKFKVKKGEPDRIDDRLNGDRKHVKSEKLFINNLDSTNLVNRNQPNTIITNWNDLN